MGTGNLKVRIGKTVKGLETVTTKNAAGNTTVMNGGGVNNFAYPASGKCSKSLLKDGIEAAHEKRRIHPHVTSSR